MRNNKHNIKVRLNRSELAVPGSRTEFFEKAARSEADIIFLDLEDSVSINQKLSARKNVIEVIIKQINIKIMRRFKNLWVKLSDRLASLKDIPDMTIKLAPMHCAINKGIPCVIVFSSIKLK